MTDSFWKDRKIIAYIALRHHTRFITPIMEELVRQGARVRYIVGQAERSQEITAIECKLPFRHLFDYVSEKDQDAVHQNYLLLRNRFGRALSSHYAIGTQVLTVIDKTLHATATEYIGCRNLIETEKPDLCFALHELNRWGKMLAFWSKKYAVPFITLQEGLGYNLDFGYMGHVQYSTLNLVWGERIKKKFSDFEAPKDKIIPVGNSHLATEIKKQKKNNTRGKMQKKFKAARKQVILLIFSARLPDVNPFKPLLAYFSRSKEDCLVIKFHPASRHPDITRWKTGIESFKPNTISAIHGEESTYDLISMCDVCVLAQPSTTGLEALAFSKPLVQLDLGVPDHAAYSFVQQEVAVKMTVDQLVDHLAGRRDFDHLVTKEAIDAYFKNELCDTENTVHTIIDVFKSTVQANQSGNRPPLVSETPANLKWSVIVPVSDDPKIFLLQLEQIAGYSEGAGGFEVILVHPDPVSEKISAIIDSLEGDVSKTKYTGPGELINAMNRAAISARGEYLVFLSPDCMPASPWLESLNTGFTTHGYERIFGAIISDRNDNIIHAGMVIDENNAPVSAYLHLDSDFPQARAEKSFMAFDYFIAVKKERFLETSGFTKEAGVYFFMDFCLSAADDAHDPTTCMLCPEIRITCLNNRKKDIPQEDAIYFYSRWHGLLWENETRTYEKDGISKSRIDTARLTRAMELSNRTVI